MGAHIVWITGNYLPRNADTWRSNKAIERVSVLLRMQGLCRAADGKTGCLLCVIRLRYDTIPADADGQQPLPELIAPLV